MFYILGEMSKSCCCSCFRRSDFLPSQFVGNKKPNLLTGEKVKSYLIEGRVYFAK